MGRLSRRRFVACGLGAVGSVSGCLRLDDGSTPTAAAADGPAAAGPTQTPAPAGDRSTPEPAERPDQATGDLPGSIRGTWGQFQVDAANTGAHPAATGPTSLPAEAWSFPAFDSFVVDANPIVAEGVLVIGNSDHTVYALNAADGTEVWSYDAGAPVWGTPAYHDGTVLVGSGPDDDQKALTAFDLESGDVRWQRDLNANQLSPAIADGRAYFAEGDLYAVDVASGSTVWTQDVGGKTSPAVADGVVYVGSGGARPTNSGAGRVFAFDAADGARVWRARIDEKVTKRCQQTVADGRVLVGGHQGTLFALDAQNGDVAWRYSVGDGILSSPAVADGVAYVGSGHWEAAGRHVHAIDVADGSRRWRSDAGAPVFSSPAVADGVVYVGDEAGTVSALAAGDGSVVWRADVGGAINAAPVVLDGTVFVATSDGIVTALREAS